MSDLAKRVARRKARHRNPRREMTFLEHLDELRGRLIICVVGILLTTIVGGIFFARGALLILTRPFESSKDKMIEKPTDRVLKLEIRPDGTLVALNPQILANPAATTGTVRAPNPNASNGARATSGTLATAKDQRSQAKRSRPTQRIDWVKIVGQDGSEWFFGGGGRRPGIIATTMFGPFLTLIKVAIILGIVFAIPIWLWQLWLFVAPAFTPNERRVVRPVLLSGIFLFPMGVAFAYAMFYFVMPFALEYAEKIAGVPLMPDIQKYMSFALNFMLAMGLVFETPLVMLLLVRMRIVSTRTLKKSRSYAVVIICILSAVLTPQDPISMIAMAIPMLLLFEISLLVASVVESKLEAADRELAEPA